MPPERRVAFRLARELRIADVDGMLDAIPISLYREWQTYLQCEPPTGDRVDVMLAQLTALTAEINRDHKRRLSRFDIQDFYPRYDGSNRRPKPIQTPDEQRAVLERAGLLPPRRPKPCPR